ncbi:unnamed protein product [Leptidea sinapis]|uniref:GAR domain-containing protein n=1 Tax=Leptidea sinapis TaxID=189913 RepID=A0A5E4PMK4_9NEOP|nr:unnamed protein product [Leptidea sinapis]
MACYSCDRQVFNAFDRNRKMSSTFADCALAAQSPSSDDEDLYREKTLHSQARQLFPLQEDLADWINKTIGITYLNGENFLDVLDNGVELCQLASVIHDKAREALDQGLIVGPVPTIRGKCWQRAGRGSFFSRDNAENFITFCRNLGVHENLLFESDDLVVHNQPRQVILCLLEVARLATRYAVEPPGLVQLEKEIAAEECDSGLESSMSGAWHFRDASPPLTAHSSKVDPTPATPENDSSAVDNCDAASTKSGDSGRSGSSADTDTDVPLNPTNELDKRVQTITSLLERGCRCNSEKCSRMLKMKKVGEGRYKVAGRNVFIRLLKGRHMMVRVGGGWDTLEHFLSRHEPCQVRLVTPAAQTPPLAPPPAVHPRTARKTSPIISNTKSRPQSSSSAPEPRPLRSARTPTEEKKPFVAAVPKKSRSMSLAHVSSDNKFCGTDRLNKSRSASISGPQQTTQARPRSLHQPTTLYTKKARSMSILMAGDVRKPLSKSASVTGERGAPITQASIEESIRASLEARIADVDSTKKPFLHIKAKYRGSPPREVPPR